PLSCPQAPPHPNPIEQVFAKFKTLLRKVGGRSYEAISDACGKILAQYPPAACAAYLKNAGYAEPQKQDALVLGRRADLQGSRREQPESAGDRAFGVTRYRLISAPFRRPRHAPRRATLAEIYSASI